jgi:hypothetical protein
MDTMDFIKTGEKKTALKIFLKKTTYTKLSKTSYTYTDIVYKSIF